MTQKDAIKLFEDRQVRSVWDSEAKKWYISIIDVIEVLTDSANPRRYWSDLKRKLQAEGSQLYENIVQLKMKSSDGKSYNTDVADVEQLFRLIQSTPSKTASPVHKHPKAIKYKYIYITLKYSAMYVFI